MTTKPEAPKWTRYFTLEDVSETLTIGENLHNRLWSMQDPIDEFFLVAYWDGFTAEEQTELNTAYAAYKLAN